MRATLSSVTSSTTRLAFWTGILEVEANPEEPVPVQQAKLLYQTCLNTGKSPWGGATVRAGADARSPSQTPWSRRDYRPCSRSWRRWAAGRWPWRRAPGTRRPSAGRSPSRGCWASGPSDRSSSCTSSRTRWTPPGTSSPWTRYSSHGVGRYGGGKGRSGMSPKQLRLVRAAATAHGAVVARERSGRAGAPNCGPGG